MIMKIKNLKKGVCLLLAVLLLTALSATAFADSKQTGPEPGDPMPDFTVSLTDGTNATLSELLKEKDLVVLNVFATWCGPCEKEFPEMEKSFQAHSDRMVILSVSGDPNDSLEMVADYKDGHGLSFPMGVSGGALDFLGVTAFPTTYFIDRSGTVLFYKVGAFIVQGDFEDKVSTFLSSDFDGSPLAAEKVSPFRNLYLLAACLLCALLFVIGRWRLFRKAGKPGWLSFIPVVATCQEFSICWKGWLGLVSLLCQAGSAAIALFASNGNGTFLLLIALQLAALILGVPENFKLAKAYGKGAGYGVLLLLFHHLGRFVLGVSKAEYRGDALPEKANVQNG